MRSRPRSRQFFLILICCLLLAGFVAARSVPLPRQTKTLASPAFPNQIGSVAQAQTQPPTVTPATSPAPISSPTPSPVVPPPTISRDLSQYENGGTLSMADGLDATRRAVFSQARSFLLRKWDERQLGRIALTSTTPTGRPTTGNFYVERDTAGTWRVVLEAEGRAREEFYFVEEVGVAADGRPILESRQGGQQPVSRALHLKKSAGANSGLVL